MTVSDATNAPTAEEYSYLSHSQILVVLGGVMAGMFLAALDQSIVGTALPRIVSDLGGLEHLSWVVTAYLLTSTASTPLWGKISDLYGRRPIFQTAIVVFLVGSLVGRRRGHGRAHRWPRDPGTGRRRTLRACPVDHRRRHTAS